MGNHNVFGVAMTVSGVADCCWPDCEARSGEELPLCQTHASEVWWSEQQWRMRARPSELQPAVVVNKKPAIIYYASLPGDLIKIGTTGNLVQRLKALRLDPEAVLATEYGDRQLEALRHRQFAVDRIGTRENFMASEALLSHIKMIAAHSSGNPQKTW